MDKQLIADIILGTHEHDRFKPFWLGNFQHAVLGYAQQRNSGKSEPHCVSVLLHDAGGFWANRTWHLQTWSATQRQLPQALALAPVVDWIASASYSLIVDQDSEAEEAGAGTTPAARDGLSGHRLFEKKWPASVQNPFTRLPRRDGVPAKGRLQIEINPEGGFDSGGNFVVHKFRAPFLISNALPGVAADLRALDAAASRGDQAGSAGQGALFAKVVAAVQSLSADQKQALEDLYPVFTERTYPTANDTALAFHTRLAANIFHLLLAHGTESVGLGGLGLESLTPADLQTWHAQANRDQAASRVIDLLGCYVVTVRLAGLEERFAGAVRLDDLQGAKQLADRVRAAFKLRMAQALGFDSIEGFEPLADVLCLSDSRFSMTYLLPASFADQESTVVLRLLEVFQDCLQDVVGFEYDPDDPEIGAQPGLLQLLMEDLGQEGRRFLVPDAASLLASLQGMLPAIGISRVDPATISGDPPAERFGTALVEAYAQSQAQAARGVIPAAAWRDLKRHGQQEGEDQPLCTNCHAAPAWTALTDHAFGRNDAPQIESLQKFFHAFRDEREELCPACVAQRALAHGVTQVDALRTMVQGTLQADGSIKLEFADLRSPQADKPLALPPQLHYREQIEADEDGLVDLNAVYVRRRRGAGPDPLDRFPSVAYAADRNSNVVMLTLRPNLSAIHDSLTFKEKFITSRLQHADSATSQLQAHYDLTNYYFNLPREGGSEEARKPLLEVKPHLARVLQRQKTVTRFFQAVTRRWQAAGVRVLALEDIYPVGRYLLPAEALTDALEVLDLSLCLDLLSVNGKDLGLDDSRAMSELDGYNVLRRDAGQRARQPALRSLLAAYVPNLLVGTALVFKQKQPLYLMLRAEERLQREVKPEPVLAMGLADMRGTLVDRGQLHAGYAFQRWDDLLAAARLVDRRSLEGISLDWDRVQQAVDRYGEESEEAVAMARLAEARWLRRASATDVKLIVAFEQLGATQEEDRRKAAFFLQRAARGKG